MARTLALATLLLGLTLTVACGGSHGAASGNSPARAVQPSAGAETAAIEDPLDAFDALLDALNRRDAGGVLDRLSAEARAAFSSEQTARLIADLAGRDPNFRITRQKVNSRARSRDQAQIGLTLLVHYQGLELPLTDVAFLVLEDGRWRLADHFLQTALAAVGQAPPPMEPRTYRADGCVEGDVLAGVYLPSRLDVLNPCVTIEGVVLYVERPEAGEGDGDISFDVALAGDDQRLLNDDNRRNTHGGLHLEIVPADQDRLPLPKVGQRIRAQGPWVLDTVHGHNEIHPVWSLHVIGE